MLGISSTITSFSRELANDLKTTCDLLCISSLNVIFSSFSLAWTIPKIKECFIGLRTQKPDKVHTTSNLAIYSHETSQDKLPEAYDRQSINVIQMHDKLHEKLFISICSFL